MAPKMKDKDLEKILLGLTNKQKANEKVWLEPRWGHQMEGLATASHDFFGSLEAFRVRVYSAATVSKESYERSGPRHHL